MPDRPEYIDPVLWAAIWKAATPELERVRAADVNAMRLDQFIMELADLFQATLARTPLRNTSGLVEQQKLFQRLR